MDLYAAREGREKILASAIAQTVFEAAEKQPGSEKTISNNGLDPIRHSDLVKELNARVKAWHAAAEALAPLEREHLERGRVSLFVAREIAKAKIYWTSNGPSFGPGFAERAVARTLDR